MLSDKADVRFNSPITLGDSEPEAEIAIVRLPESAYNDRHCAPEDIFWIVEVAKTSLKKDLEIKAEIYAAAAIQEYWVFARTITLLAFKDVLLSVKKLLS